MAHRDGLQHLYMTSTCRQMDGSAAVALCNRGVAAVVQQRLCSLLPVQLCRPVGGPAEGGGHPWLRLVAVRRDASQGC